MTFISQGVLRSFHPRCIFRNFALLSILITFYCARVCFLGQRVLRTLHPLCIFRNLGALGLAWQRLFRSLLGFNRRRGFLSCLACFLSRLACLLSSLGCFLSRLGFLFLLLLCLIQFPLFFFRFHFCSLGRIMSGLQRWKLRLELFDLCEPAHTRRSSVLACLVAQVDRLREHLCSQAARLAFPCAFFCAGVRTADSGLVTAITTVAHQIVDPRGVNPLGRASFVEAEEERGVLPATCPSPRLVAAIIAIAIVVVHHGRRHRATNPIVAKKRGTLVLSLEFWCDSVCERL
mmetsp:Transcript_21150/g.56370  ORF Transcript_21150/g.56370 Transcript_21150/m.56370 type:complete len:290 (-) Transcript_21150:78-947(-)